MCHYKDALSAAKSEYYAILIRSGEGKGKNLLSTLNCILQSLDNFPPRFHWTGQCNIFMTFFNSKISNIY